MTSRGAAVIILFSLLFIVVTLVIGQQWKHDRMVTEDMSGWDCHTMGNLECGSGTIPPVTFDKADR